MSRRRSRLAELVADATRRAVTDVLADHRGNRTHTALALGVTRSTLQRLLKRLKITHWEVA